MLIDPDSPSEEFQIEVRAKDIGAALVQCEAFISSAEAVELLNVSQRTKTPDKNGNCKFVCWYKREVEANDSNDR
ncbi:MAG: hypothetical protein RLZZ511_2952 [Cyanobacteriota bacterium]|jgi:hypothetical protein